jgi:serine phosphatase RsbU (regulator of sigma subunit)
MKLSTLSHAFISSALLAFALNAWMLWSIQEQQKQVDYANQHRIDSLALTKRIENDIDHLSQFVRAYTSTGVTAYLMYYYDLRDIRKGLQPEPEGYNDQYWHEVMTGTRQHLFERKHGKKQSLSQRLTALAFTREETEILEKMLAISEDMAKTEQIAFAATQGLYDPKTQVFIDDGEPQIAFAISLVNSIDYLQRHNALMSEVEHLAYTTHTRTQTRVKQAQEKVHEAIAYAISMAVISTLLLFSMGYVIFRRILYPLKQLIIASEKLEQNQYETRANLGKSVTELKHLARKFNEMAASIEADMMLRNLTQEELTEEKQKVEKAHQHIQDSINYAALIQKALIPNESELNTFFREQINIWKPKDTVGGDIYLFTTLRHPDECLLMIMDCTGHGVPGAFLTMLVKAIHQQLVSDIQYRKHTEVSPAKLLSEFNVTLKKLLKQEEKAVLSEGKRDANYDVGFDGAIIYCDKQRNLIRFASAQTSVFYLNGDDLNVVKGDRQSIGYYSSKADFEFTNHDIIATPYTTFYVTTDGYIDQNGGEKGFPFGRKRFQRFIMANKDRSLNQQKIQFLAELNQHQQGHIQNDDITLLAFRL